MTETFDLPAGEALFGLGEEQRGIALETGGGILKFYAGGLTDLITTMQALGPKITAKLIKGALARAAEPMLHAARSLAPMSPEGSHGREPGFLLSQIVLVMMTSTRVRGSYSAAVTIGGRGLYAGEGFYGAFVELGHHLGKRSKAVVRRRKVERNAPGEFRDWWPG